jgi:hypothetical protein
MRWWSGLLAVGPWLGLVFALPATGQSERPESAEEVRVHEACSGCHAFPPPESLPRHTWRSVVADMAVLILEGVGAPPDQPPPPPDFDLERLAHYFESRAPRALPSPAPWPAAPERPWPFERKSLGGDREGRPAAVANVRLLRLAPEARHRVVATDMLSGEVLAADPLKPSEGFAVLGHASNPVHAEAVDLDRDGHLDLLVSDLGDPAPSDHLEGAVVLLRGRGDGGYDPLTLASGLPRVADTRAGDFDGDGDLDLVVAAFGWRRVGSIMLLENRTTDWRRPDFAHRVLDGRSGAIHVPVMDLDGDGKLDFVALLSQHHEAVIAFLGDGTGGFRQEVVDRAPHPAWGSSGLQIADLDGDGDLDALVTNGDMLDDFQLKPYHGVRWLENRGGFPFVPHAIAPMFCVMRAQAADLDGDGEGIGQSFSDQLAGAPYARSS